MLRISQIKIKVQEDSFDRLKRMVSKKLKTKESNIESILIRKKSIDARQKPLVYFVYEVDVKINEESSFLSFKDVQASVMEEYQVPTMGKNKLSHRPIVVGSGPAGLFAALLLAENGYKPLILERGECVEERIKSVEEFWKTGKLNSESNVQFGEGGAGTFSDGKLNTMVKDKFHRGKKVFETFVRCGADQEILYDAHPHIGTDKLREVIKNLRQEIIELGGEFFYHTKLTDLKVEKNQIQKIEINHQKWIDTEILILAIGHSARDTFQMLSQYLTMESKPFAVGLRVMHSQERINESQYGEAAKFLPPANYKLTYHTKSGRGVYSFCMCPGGYVVNASSEAGRLAINGMSEHNRDTANANSAIVVTVSKSDYGPNLFDGMEFQRRLEEKAFQIKNGCIPVQLYQDFVAKRESTSFGSVEAITKGSVCFADLNEILPLFIADSIKEAMPYFEKKIKGFAQGDSLLFGIESRTSSPIRIVRDEQGHSNIRGIYPSGEGAGYAGGITSAAMDGLFIAEQVIASFTPNF